MNDPVDDRQKRTIVGGRPRGRGLGGTGIPRGIEVLIKKASLDPAFCTLLLEQRAAAASQIALKLTPAETAILNSVPEAQLQAMIDHIKVPDTQRRAFLGQLGAAMLAAVVAGCTPPTVEATPIEVEKGLRPDEEDDATPTLKATSTPEAVSTTPPVVTGTRPDVEQEPPSPVVRGIRPDRP